MIENLRSIIHLGKLIMLACNGPLDTGRYWKADNIQSAINGTKEGQVGGRN